MARAAVDISLLGAKELEKSLKKLPDLVQRTVVRASLRKVTKRVHKETLARVPVDTGNLKEALAAENKPRLQTFPNAVVYYMDLPSRASLGIAKDTRTRKRGYYPIHLEHGFVNEFGVPVAPRPYIRPAVDENIDVYHGMMRHDINKGIIRKMKKLAKK